MRSLLNECLHLIYPSFCLQCGCKIENFKEIFCFSCGSHLDLIDPSERCPICFSPDYSTTDRRCSECERKGKIYHRIASAFDYIGPAALMIKKFKYGGAYGYAKGIAAFMAAQWIELDWPRPDYLVPVPISITHRFRRGYNQSFLIAKEMERYLEAPSIDPLARLSGGFSQASLSLKSRKELGKENFSFRKRFKREVLRDKIVLVIDDVLTTGTTLRCCGERLSEAYPDKLFALTVCRSLK